MNGNNQPPKKPDEQGNINSNNTNSNNTYSLNSNNLWSLNALLSNNNGVDWDAVFQYFMSGQLNIPQQSLSSPSTSNQAQQTNISPNNHQRAPPNINNIFNSGYDPTAIEEMLKAMIMSCTENGINIQLPFNVNQQSPPNNTNNSYDIDDNKDDRKQDVNSLSVSSTLPLTTEISSNSSPMTSTTESVSYTNRRHRWYNINKEQNMANKVHRTFDNMSNNTSSDDYDDDEKQSQENMSIPIPSAPNGNAPNMNARSANLGNSNVSQEENQDENGLDINVDDDVAMDMGPSDDVPDVNDNGNSFWNKFKENK